jgi:VWFA-related protein
LTITGLQWSDAGNYTVAVTNLAGPGVSTAAGLTILNQGPVWTSVPGTNAKVGEVYSYTLRASDAEGNTLSFSATTLPSWLTLQCSGVGNSAAAKGSLGLAGDGIVAVASEPALLAISSAQWTPLPEVNEARLAEPRYYEGDGWVYPTVNSQVPLAPVAPATKRQPNSGARVSVSPLATEFPAIYLYLTVLDDGGNAVTHLTQNDFYVWEQASGESNAVAEAITSFGETSGGGAGISFSLVFDVSGSMSATPLTDPKQAAITLLANTAPSDRGNLVQFSSYNEVSLVLASDWVTADADHHGISNLQEAIQSLMSLNNTALFDGAANGVESLSQEPKPKAVAMFTDGGENSSVTYNANTLIAKANNEGVPIYTIGLGAGADNTLLTSLATQTGGSYHYAPTAADLAAVYSAIAKEVRSRYVLGYRTHNTNFDGTMRTVTVNARGTTGSGVYRVNSTPQPLLDLPTQNLSQQSQPPGLALVISGTLTDLDAQSGGQSLAGTLYYRAAGGSVYSQVALGLTALGNGRYTFAATIPGGSVVYPGLYYYLRFTDGIQEVYLPFNYNTVPISISVLENHAPVTTHTSLGMAIPG